MRTNRKRWDRDTTVMYSDDDMHKRKRCNTRSPSFNASPSLPHPSSRKAWVQVIQDYLCCLLLFWTELHLKRTEKIENTGNHTDGCHKGSLTYCQKREIITLANNNKWYLYLYSKCKIFNSRNLQKWKQLKILKVKNQ